MAVSTTTTSTFLASSTTSQTEPIVIKSSDFFYTNGTQFFIRGVTYNIPNSGGGPGSLEDPIGPYSSCDTDSIYLIPLGVNTIYISGLHQKVDHTFCMDTFRDAGICVLIDLGDYSNPDDPQVLSIDDNTSSLSWHDDIYSSYTEYINTFASYSNVLGFVVGQSSSDPEFWSSQSSRGIELPNVKAAIRDTKTYMNSSGYRPIPIGILAANDSFTSGLSASYLNCGNSNETVDFWAIQTTWCGTEGRDLISTYENYGIPVFFGSYDCDTTTDFGEVGLLYQSSMSTVFSGGFRETSGDVLNGSTDSASNYSLFSTQLSGVSPSPIQRTTYLPTNSRYSACPTDNSTWVAYQTLPPTPNHDLCQCMYNSLSCVVSEGWEDSQFWDQVYQQSSDVTFGWQQDTTVAYYGAYSICKVYQMVSWSINQLYQSQIALGQTPKCNNITNSAQVKTPSSNPGCDVLVAAAGPLGTNTVTAELADVASASSSSNTSPLEGDPSRSRSTLSPGAIGGTVVGVVTAISIAIGIGIFWWRKRKAKAAQRSLSPNGLEVDTGQSTKIELSGDSLKPEMWTNRNTTELPASIGLRIPGSEHRGSYTPVANEEGNESTGEAVELESNSICSPYLGNSPGTSPNTSPNQGSISPMSPRLSQQVVSSSPRITEIDAEFALNHEYRESSHSSQAS